MKSTQSLRIVVTGLIAQHPRLGGVAWDYVQYPAALHRMGHDVYYVEDSGEWPYRIDGGPTGNDWIARDPAANVKHLAAVMERFGLGERWAYRFPIEPRWYGLADARREEVLNSADLLLNVSGTLEHPSEYRRAKRLAYIDSDPVFTQVKLAKADHADFAERAAAHDVHFSFGECLDGTNPQWRATRQPILLDEWQSPPEHRGVYTTVMSWTSYKPLSHNGETYAQKDVEFERFLDLPSRASDLGFEVAVGGLQHADWQTSLSSSPVDRLRRAGWTVIDSMHACADLDSYRQYIGSSKGEWSVAKNGYVKGRPGWFSCRSACYLAAGRPVVVQDTGFGGVIPTGTGILPFADPDDAVEALGCVEADYPRHARAARELARAYFDSEVVLTRLIEDAYN